MHNFGKTLIIVPCGKKKIWDENSSAGRTPAKYAYTSNYFKLCVQYAEEFSDGWVIFSGKYGLIAPDFMVANYDTRIKTSDEFRNKIKEQLKTFISSGVFSFVSLCGKDYSQILKEVGEPFGLKLHTPLEGLRIGMKQKRIKECLELNVPL
ncbi:MAG: hypothetical protein QMD80_05340 [archaeon]|nr:hypothetical protein [archaeon]